MGIYQDMETQRAEFRVFVNLFIYWFKFPKFFQDLEKAYFVLFRQVPTIRFYAFIEHTPPSLLDDLLDFLEGIENPIPNRPKAKCSQ